MQPTALSSLAVVALLAAPASARQVQALVAHYDLDEVDGPVAHDTSTNIQDGRFGPGVELGLPGAEPATGRAARFGLEHSSDASIMEPAGLGLMRSNLSISAWIQPEAEAEVMRIFSSADFGWSCARTTTGLMFSVRYVQDFAVDCDVPLHQWSHVAFVYDGDFDVTFYLDGLRIGTQNGIWPAYTPAPEWHVGSLDGVEDIWRGLLDDVQVYAGALTAEDVAWLHAHPGETIDPIVGTPYCFGDGHATPCPCFNYGDHDGGCINSTGAGARLVSSGSNGVTADDFSFAADRLPADNPVLLFVGLDAVDEGEGSLFGDGLRCASGGLLRLGVENSDPSGRAVWEPGLARVGAWTAGDTRHFQAWYRDPIAGPCGEGFNLSQGIQVVFGL